MPSFAGRREVQVSIIVLAAVLAGSAACFSAVTVGKTSWAYSGEEGQPLWGVSFACREVEYQLGIGSDEPAAIRAPRCGDYLRSMAADQGFERVRFSVYWKDVEVAPGTYDWTIPDAQIAAAEELGLEVLLTVGMRAIRHPEFYIPHHYRAWERVPEGGDPSTDPAIHAGALEFITAAVERYASSPAVEAWQAENEPDRPTVRAYDWVLGEQWVDEVVAVIRTGDASARPIIVTHSSYFAWDEGWERALDAGDVLGQGVYPWRRAVLGPFEWMYPSLMTGPLAPNLPAQADHARGLGKDLWVVEMQAEPWQDLLELGGGDPDGWSPGRMEGNLEVATRAGASRVYLWGAEFWWVRANEYGDHDYQDIARELFASGNEEGPLGRGLLQEVPTGGLRTKLLVSA